MKLISTFIINNDWDWVPVFLIPRVSSLNAVWYIAAYYTLCIPDLDKINKEELYRVY